MKKSLNLYGHTRMWQRLSGSFLREVCRKYHYQAGDMELLESVAADMRICIKDQECYEIHFAEDESRADVVLTLGEPLDRLLESYSKSGRLMQQWMAENISGELLMHGYSQIGRILSDAGWGFGRMCFWGDDDAHPLSGLPEVLRGFRSARVHSTGDGILIPSKSVVYRVERDESACDSMRQGETEGAGRLLEGWDRERICIDCPRRRRGECDFAV